MTTAALPSFVAPLSPDLPASGRWFDRLLSTRARASARRQPALEDLDAAPSLVLDESIRASIAACPEDYDAAYALVCKRYAWRGYGDLTGISACACGDTACEHRHTLIASEEGSVVGTLTLGADSEGGLFVDDSYRPEVDALRAAGRRLCEITRFAVDEQAQSKAVLASLFGLAYLLTRSVHCATDVLVEVNPRHVAFYRRMLAFTVASGERMCARVEAPSVLLRLELAALEDRLSRLGCPTLAPT
jgi:hypothetical protein